MALTSEQAVSREDRLVDLVRAVGLDERGGRVIGAAA